LQASWPEVLAPGARAGQPRNWYEAIQLTDKHLAEAFEIITRSGPAIHPQITALIFRATVQRRDSLQSAKSW